jgi:SAM-dependent methyltransferase
VSAKTRTNCNACGNILSGVLLDLGQQPLANNLCSNDHHNDTRFPLRLVRCQTCGLLQLDTIVDPAVMFSHYLYTPSQSAKMLSHFDELAEAATLRTLGGAFLGRCEPRAVDVGSNDGALLAALQKRGWRVAGVDPAENLAAQANAKGLFTIPRFFDAASVDLLQEAIGGKADLITANNVFAHTPDWRGFIENISNLLTEDGFVAFEFPYAPTMLIDGTFDLIYHEHAYYPALTPLQHVLETAGLRIIDVEDLHDIHGGSVRVWAGRSSMWASRATVAARIGAEKRIYSLEACLTFVDRVHTVRRDLVDAIKTEKARGQRIVGYTAPAKAVTLLEFCEQTQDGALRHVEFIVDDNPLKQGKMLPSSHVKIVAPGDGVLNSKTTVIIFAWNVYEEVLAKLPADVSVIVPMPDVQVIVR